MRHVGPVVCSFKFLCSKKWDELSAIEGQEGIRFCDACMHPVFLCHEYSELAEHIRMSHCIALVRPREGERRGDICLVGLPAIDPGRKVADWDDDIPF